MAALRTYLHLHAHSITDLKEVQSFGESGPDNAGRSGRARQLDIG